MADKEIKWTKQQQQAREVLDRDVLVTASAGTGKTAVLSGRSVNIITQKKCPDITGLLVLTFTDAAAEEMRGRIARDLKSEFLKTGDCHIASQIALLDSADISTIHSFCKRIITENFHQLDDIDPAFSVIDSDEQKLLKAEVLEETIRWAWDESDIATALESLLHLRSLGESNNFLNNISRISEFLDSVISRDNWYERAALLADAADPFDTDAANEQKRLIGEKLKQSIDLLDHAQRLEERLFPQGHWEDQFKQMQQYVTDCLEELNSSRWNSFVKMITTCTWEKFANKPEAMSKEMRDTIKAPAQKVQDIFKNLTSLAVMNPDYLRIVAPQVSLQTKVLIKLVKRYDQFYTDAKRTLNCLDFADLQHYAFKLLTEEDGGSSQTALRLSEKFKFILVDECQDINEIQQAILDKISGDGNVFVVGDIKQSIYAFRQAKPELFLERLNKSSPVPTDPSQVLRVDLNDNFRSVPQVLEFTNRVFSRIMTADFAAIDYDTDAELKPAKDFEPVKMVSKTEQPAVELLILDEEAKSEDDDDNEPDAISARQRQAAVIAERIKQIVGDGEFQVYDKHLDSTREVRYGDIVILMRSLANKANEYAEILRLAGVPVSGDNPGGYFQATEINDCLSLLKVLDNPRRDIELAAVLRSPIFKVTDTELAKVRLHVNTSGTDFYSCVNLYIETGPDENLRLRLGEIIEKIQNWQTDARTLSLPDLIWKIYSQSNMPAVVSALPDGPARRANLIKLHDRAIQFASFASTGGRVSLSRFVEFIEKLLEAGQDWSQAQPEISTENAVRIMSVHKAKGLEFPVVFLADLNSRFNLRDLSGDCLTDSAETLGLNVILPDLNVKAASLTGQIIADKAGKKLLAEEMRILYVALTRARQKLIITASEKKKTCQSALRDGLLCGFERIPRFQLSSARNPLKWLFYGLSDSPVLHELFGTGLAVSERAGWFKAKLYDAAELKAVTERLENLRRAKSKTGDLKIKKIKSGSKDSGLIKILKSSLSWRYRFADLADLPAKSSVSQLTHRGDEFAKADFTGCFQRKPKTVSETKPDATLIGSATHLVISQLDLTKPLTKSAIEATIESLIEEEAVTAETARQINTASIEKFFKTDLGQLATDPANKVHRELPFTFAMPVEACKDESIVVQGIIDMLIETKDRLTIIDFKTDNITPDQIEERVKLYRQQLNLYAKAAKKIFKKSSPQKHLYFLTPGKSVEV